jgi:hypothetical protein
MPELTEWNSFYVIVGSSAGALIGLQFVVLTLIAERARIRQPEATDAFATPSVVHFAIVLVLSAVLSAPWRTAEGVAVFAGVVGIAGIIYTLVVARRMRTQKVYRPVFEDWLFHVLLPLIAYALVGLSAWIVTQNIRKGLFFLGGATLVFLFVGIHNAWDSVTYAVFVHRSGNEGPN